MDFSANSSFAIDPFTRFKTTVESRTAALATIGIILLPDFAKELTEEKLASWYAKLQSNYSATIDGGFIFKTSTTPEVNSRPRVEQGSLVLEGNKFGPNCHVHKNCVVAPNNTFGKNCHIEEGCIIGPDNVFGDDCTVRTGTILRGGEKFPSNVTVMNPSSLALVCISDGVNATVRVEPIEAPRTISIKLRRDGITSSDGLSPKDAAIVH